MDKDIIKIITGIRRCSKYYLLFEIYYNYLISNGIFKDQIIAISFESRKNLELRNPDSLYKFIDEKIIDKDKYYIFIDEVQMLDDF